MRGPASVGRRASGAGRAGIAGLGLLGLCSCTDPVPAGGIGDGDTVLSERVSPAEAGGLGGAGGQAGVRGLTSQCFPEVVRDGELPECFVAEVSPDSRDCAALGREELTSARAKAARERHCSALKLTTSACDALSVCGLPKLQGAAEDTCAAGLEPDEPGFCLADDASTACAPPAIDAILLTGGDEPLTLAADESLVVFCAIVRNAGEE